MQDGISNQIKASDPEQSVWVMASAGSGKTKVLTDRILRLLLNDVDPSSILCLTYTKVASVEMQKRLNRELQEWAICEPEILHQKLEKLLQKPPHNFQINQAKNLLQNYLDSEYKIKIQTIHSFCQSILKNFPFEAKIPINFDLIDENKSKILLKNCQNKILSDSLSNPELSNLISKINARISEQTFDKLISKLLDQSPKIYALKNQFLNIENAILEVFLFFGFSHFDADFSKIIQHYFEIFLQKIDLEKLANFDAKIPTDKKKDSESSRNIQKFLNQPSIENFQFLYSAFFTLENNLRKFSKDFTAQNHDEIDFFANLILEFSQNYHGLNTLISSSELLIIVDKILSYYQKIKFENSYLDYNDLIHRTNLMLQNSEHQDWIKYKLDYSFNHLLVDEAQDTNETQWSIIKAITDDFFSGMSKSQKPRSIFIVGDEKQSIMGFQGANILQTKEFHQYLKQKSDNILQDIDLNYSFRSGKAILKLVDLIFLDNARKQAITKVQNYYNHISFRQSKGYVEIWQNDKINELIATNAKDNPKANSKEIPSEWNLKFSPEISDSKEDIFARFIAFNIHQWVENKRLIADKNQPVQYGDIMILVRKKNDAVIEKLCNYFNKLQIPFLSVGKIKFSENLLIQDFLALARFALLPSDCFNLACLLKSPFFNLSEPELFDFCQIKNSQNISLFASFFDSKHQNNLQKILLLAKQNNCYDFYFQILNDEIHQENIFARFGNQSEEIINNFLFICQDFSQNNNHNLQNFLEFCEQIDPEISLDLSNSNAVKISTVHSSKGLQAPIIILPDTIYNYYQQNDNKVEILWNQNFPLWLNADSNINPKIKNLTDDLKHKNYEEHLRLLYVALTRAQDEIYIGGCAKDFDDKCWYHIINNTKDDEFNYKQVEFIDNSYFLPKNNNINDFYLKLSDFNYFIDQKHNLNNENIVNDAVYKGKIIHQAMEIIAQNYQMPKTWISQQIRYFLDNKISDNNQLLQEILTLSQNFLNSKIFDEIFHTKYQKFFSEYQISNQNQIFRLDLIGFGTNEIIIIDYKSDEIINQTNQQKYFEQIENYQNILQNNYPKLQINSAILWLQTLELNFL